MTASPHAFYRAKEAFRAARPLSSVWHCQAHFSRMSRRPRYQQLATAGSPPRPAARLPSTSRRPKLCAHNKAQRPQPQAAHPTPPHSTPSPAAEPHDLAPPARDVRRHRWHVQSLCRRDRCQLHQAAPARKAGARLCHDERVEGALSVLLGALEPALVANLHLEQVQVAVADRRVDQLVAAALVAVRCARSTLSLLSTVSAQATLCVAGCFLSDSRAPSLSASRCMAKRRPHVPGCCAAHSMAIALAICPNGRALHTPQRSVRDQGAAIRAHYLFCTVA